jgi:hypothetical protein
MSRASRALRGRVRRRARGFCKYCRCCSELTGHEFTLDHAIPASRGGATSFDNLTWCWFWCNNYKQAQVEALDERTGRIVALFNPRTNRWSDHFRWSLGGTRIAARTAVGRVTIKTLWLNRPVLVRARRTWVRAGLHLPDWTEK